MEQKPINDLDAIMAGELPKTITLSIEDYRVLLQDSADLLAYKAMTNVYLSNLEEIIGRLKIMDEAMKNRNSYFREFVTC